MFFVFCFFILIKLLESVWKTGDQFQGAKVMENETVKSMPAAERGRQKLMSRGSK